MMQSLFQRWLAIVLVTVALVGSGCTPQDTTSSSASNANPVAPPTNVSNDQMAELPQLQGKATVELIVKGSPITIEVDGADAPITAGNFIDLVQRGVYEGLVFHRVVREPQPFVVQGGDPQSKNPNFPPEQLGTGSFIDPNTSQPRYIPLEIKPQAGERPLYGKTFEMAGTTGRPKLRHTRGAVAMARSAIPDSASSQFYIALADLNFLDGNYAVFGYVTQGMEVVDTIQQGDRIESAKVTKGAENLKPGKKV
ncbi:peptidylprolyl isomerase [Pantanalinema rosaneae CENA516]|uniref:peptidylprolyl isomerase n=1 Tax=Pantanalinema rosaneae TaxID=1620701 RepID=UPI003D6E00AF